MQTNASSRISRSPSNNDGSDILPDNFHTVRESCVAPVEVETSEKPTAKSDNFRDKVSGHSGDRIFDVVDAGCILAQHPSNAYHIEAARNVRQSFLKQVKLS